ncbi:MAG: hypothetical protein P8Y95_09765 [Gammaproteobacteria bacterium]
MGKSREWHTHVVPGKKGLTLGALNVGTYGEIPDYWDDQTRLPRGAVPRPGVPPIGYALRHKHEVWADSAADLYEEAIQRRWIPATDVPWNTIEPLSDDVEAAVCQVCTELSQAANTEIEIVSYWQEKMAYGYHEVKMFLATVTFDAARHNEVFRKRALVNGGGLGLESRGNVNRMLSESKGGWTETVAQLILQRGTLLMTIYRYLHRYAHNAAERAIYARCLQDKARHLAYGLDHMHYAINHQDDQRQILNTVLLLGEATFGRELRDPVLREALAIIFAGGVDGAAAQGMDEVEHMLGDWLRYYHACCSWLGIDRTRMVHPLLAQYLEH